MTDIKTLIVEEETLPQRLDKYLAATLTDLSRSRIKALHEAGHVTVEGQNVSLSQKIKPGQTISVCIPPLEEATPTPQNIPLDIVFEDEHIIVINKPAGMVVHPAPGHSGDTLVNALLGHCQDSLSGIGGVKRPGIVHRLDKGTSGLMVVAKSDKAHQHLTAQFAQRTLKRSYLALVWGLPKPHEGTIEGNIGRSKRNRQKMALLRTGGKEAITHYEVIDCFGTLASLVQCRLETGRTHQIRVHMTESGYSLIGDPQYGRNPRKLSEKMLKDIKAMTEDNTRPALHAFKLKLIHPVTEQRLSFEVALPDDLSQLRDYLEEATTTE